MRWLRQWWSSLVVVSPHRQDVRDRIVALPALPEQARMTHRRREGVRKPKTFAEWLQRHGTRKSA